MRTVRQPEEKMPLGRTKRKWDVNVKV